MWSEAFSVVLRRVFFRWALVRAKSSHNMGKGNDQVAQVFAVIGIILLIIAVIYSLFASTRDMDDDTVVLGWKVAKSRIMWLYLTAIAFFLAAIVWANFDGKKGGGKEDDHKHHNKGKPPHGHGHGGHGAYTAKPTVPAAQGYDYDAQPRAFGSNST